MLPGDKISVLDENLSGTVTAVRGEMVFFTDEFGFPQHYPMDKLVLREPEIYNQIKIIKKPEESAKISKKHNKNPLVLDLHFEKLVENPFDFEPFERLFFQKQKLLETLDFCRKNRLKKLEIVHGIGDGTLQQMVHDVLEAQTGLDFYNKDVLHHQSGAVMVDFR